jgi:3-phenylpropionate/cinnamic acid dioxygenase small subunit
MTTTNINSGIFSGTFFQPHGEWRALPDHAAGTEAEGIATLLLEEAERLDNWRLNEWLDMFTDECVYWVPVTYDAAEPSSQVNLVYDNRALLEDRVFRLQTGRVPSQDPPSRTLRSLANPAIAGTDVTGEFLVRSVFSLAEHRPRATRTYTGRYLHRLRRAGPRWLIAGKKISLLTSDEPLPSLTFLL